MKVHAAKMKSFDTKNFSMSSQQNPQEKINRGQMAARLAKIVVNQKRTTRNAGEVSPQIRRAEFEQNKGRDNINVLHCSPAEVIS